MKYAFLAKNFRALSLEEKGLLAAHVLTAVMCFFPWVSIEPFSGGLQWHNAFSGAGWLIGVCIFLLSLFVTFVFVDELWESHRVKLPLKKELLFLLASGQQLLLLLLAWSVVGSVASGFEIAEVRFGLFASLLAQVGGLMAAYLHHQNLHKKNVRAFFEHPKDEDAKSKKSSQPML